MEQNVERLLHRVSLCLIFTATLCLLHLFYRLSFSCTPPSLPLPHHESSPSSKPFPKSSCESFSRPILSPSRRFSRLRNSRAFTSRATAFSSIFHSLRSLGVLSNSSHVLCVPSGAGHDVFALRESGVGDVTGVDLLDFPPLVRRADPHNLPFFDSVFDLAFSFDGIAGALFPVRFAAEIERAVRKSGAIVVILSDESVVEKIGELFKRSSVMETRNVSLDGKEMSLILMTRNVKDRSNSLA